jgi:uncharacterized protein
VERAPQRLPSTRLRSHHDLRPESAPAPRAAEQYCVTLNAGSTIAPQRILQRIAYEHPSYTLGALEAQRPAQRLLRRENGQRHTFYCGAWLGYGFHEDGVVSALEVVRLLDERRAAA